MALGTLRRAAPAFIDCAVRQQDHSNWSEQADWPSHRPSQLAPSTAPSAGRGTRAHCGANTLHFLAGGPGRLAGSQKSRRARQAEKIRPTCSAGSSVCWTGCRQMLRCSVSAVCFGRPCSSAGRRLQMARFDRLQLNTFDFVQGWSTYSAGSSSLSHLQAGACVWPGRPAAFIVPLTTCRHTAPCGLL